MKNGASLAELTRERLARRLAAGHGAECDTCDTVFTVDNPGRLCRYGYWQCLECEPVDPPDLRKREGMPDYDCSLAGWRKCTWCGVARHYNSGGSGRHSCTDYCSIRRSRHGGLDTHTNSPDDSKCRHCGDTFYPRRKSAKFCGSTCRQAAHRSPSIWGLLIKEDAYRIGGLPVGASQYIDHASTSRAQVDHQLEICSSVMADGAKEYPHEWSIEVVISDNLPTPEWKHIP
jgi:hypothetical protein